MQGREITENMRFMINGDTWKVLTRRGLNIELCNESTGEIEKFGYKKLQKYGKQI